MKKNEEYMVKCIDLSPMALGIVKIEGQVVFVPNLLIGEEARIRIVHVKKTYAFGKVMERLSDSNLRQDPICMKARLCGGCQLQHMSYEAEKIWKQTRLETLAIRQLPYSVPVLPLLTAKDPYGYRNKAQFPVGIKEDRVEIGFYRSHSHDIVDTDRCFLQDPVIQDVYERIRNKLSVEMARGLRHIMIRTSQKTKQIQLVWIGSQKNDWSKIHEDLNSHFGPLASIIYNENKRKDNVILGSEYEVLQGKDHILESCMGNEIELHFKSFFQVNPVMMEKLYQAAIEQAHLTKEMTVIELYSGTGTIGLAVSFYVKKVIGVEIVPEAVENAKANAKRNGITNCEFICEDASAFVKKAKQRKVKADVVLIDPPRKGMTSQGIEDVTELDPLRIVYISCNPDTLIRDLGLFDQIGYQAISLQPCDMFSRTINMETIAVLERR